MWRTGTLSLAYLTVNGADPLQHIEAAAAAGYQAAGLRLLPPRHLSNAPAVVGNPALIRDIKRACSRTGIRLLDAEVASLTPASTRSELSAMVDAAAELDFRFIQTVVEDPDRQRASDSLGMLAELASDVGMTIALEFMRFRDISNLAQAMDLIEITAYDNVRVLIDALHLARSDGSAADVARLRSDWIALAQLCDAPAMAPSLEQLPVEARTARLHPGEGALPLAALLDALPDDLPLSIEVPNSGYERWNYPERARRALAATTRLLNSRD
jgi:sugar phosphate isomerase/epimerase